MRNYRITNKFRFTAFVVIMIILLTTAVNFALGHNTAQSMTKTKYMELEISSGDTLWSIAETYMTDSDDIRQSVYKLCKLNDISADTLYAGMTILVPICG